MKRSYRACGAATHDSDIPECFGKRARGDLPLGHAHSAKADNKGLSQRAHYDVVILGAGVAGLLLASELSRVARVLVLERNERPAVTKYWVTTEEALTRNADLASAADWALDSMDFIAFDGATYRSEGSYRLWNTTALTCLLLQRTQERGGVVAFGQTFYSYARGRTGLTIMANGERITARLAIDCMGHQSPIIMAEGCGRIAGYYLLHGATFPMTGTLMPVALHNLSLSEHAAYVEAFPTSDGQLHIVLIIPARELRPSTNLSAEFEFVVRRSPYSKFIADPRKRSFLGGIIPVVRIKRRALDRLFFYGEAGQVHPAASGTALTRMLLSYRDVAAFLADRLQHDRLAASELSEAPGKIGRLNQAIQLALFRDILQWSSRRFRTIVVEADRLRNHQLMNELFFGDFDTTAAGVAMTLRTLTKARNWTLLSAFAGGMARAITT